MVIDNKYRVLGLEAKKIEVVQVSSPNHRLYSQWSVLHRTEDGETRGLLSVSMSQRILDEELIDGVRRLCLCLCDTVSGIRLSGDPGIWFQ